jgi:prevent-host-death family protein
MPIVNIHAAKTHLSKLIERMEAGEEVIIARAGRPVARLAPLTAPGSADSRAAAGDLPSWMGSLRGQIRMAPDLDDDWAEEIRLMEDGPIWPSEPSEA